MTETVETSSRRAYRMEQVEWAPGPLMLMGNTILSRPRCTYGGIAVQIPRYNVSTLASHYASTASAVPTIFVMA